MACSPCSERTRVGSSPHARTIRSTCSQNASSPLFQYTSAVLVRSPPDGRHASVSTPQGQARLFARNGASPINPAAHSCATINRSISGVRRIPSHSSANNAFTGPATR